VPSATRGGATDLSASEDFVQTSGAVRTAQIPGADRTAQGGIQVASSQESARLARSAWRGLRQGRGVARVPNPRAAPVERAALGDYWQITSVDYADGLIEAVHYGVGCSTAARSGEATS
jgi:hypothetical protein